MTYRGPNLSRPAERGGGDGGAASTLLSGFVPRPTSSAAMPLWLEPDDSDDVSDHAESGRRSLPLVDCAAYDGGTKPYLPRPPFPHRAYLCPSSRTLPCAPFPTIKPYPAV